MVADIKKQRRIEFGELLNSALDRRRYPARGRIKLLHERLKIKGVELVSYESVRKWLAGKDMPDQANYRELCARIGINPAELEPENNKSEKAGKDTSFGELMSLWYASTPAGRAHILAAAKFAATGGKPGSDDTSPPLQRSGS